MSWPGSNEWNPTAEESKLQRSLLLRFPKFSKAISPEDLLLTITQHVDNDQVISLGRMMYESDWDLTLSSEDARIKLLTVSVLTVKGKKCVIYPMSPSEVTGRMHWLPYDINEDLILEMLRRFGEVVFLKNESSTGTSNEVHNCIRMFSLFLKSGVTKDDIPHFITLNKFEGLVVIKGREPMCLGCRQPGHRKSNCDQAVKFSRKKTNIGKKDEKPVNPERGAKSGASAMPSQGNDSQAKHKKPLSNNAKSTIAVPESAPGTSHSKQQQRKTLADFPDMSGLQVLINSLSSQLENVMTSFNANADPKPEASGVNETSAAKRNKKKKKKKTASPPAEPNPDPEVAIKEENAVAEAIPNSMKDSFDSGLVMNHASSSSLDDKSPSNSLSSPTNTEQAKPNENCNGESNPTVNKVNKKSKKKKKKCPVVPVIDATSK